MRSQNFSTTKVFTALIGILLNLSTPPAFSDASRVTVVVKKIAEPSDSGDGIDFTATSGKGYYLYIEDHVPIEEQKLLFDSVKNNKPICLALCRNNECNGGDIKGIKKGVCKK